MSVERIIAAVVDTRLLTLYREDGSTIEIPQGDPRVRDIIEQVMPVVQSGKVAEVDLSRLPNAYKEFEQKSSGIVRLFRVAKKAVESIFAAPAEEPVPTVEPGVFGKLPGVSNNMMNAVDEILLQADSVSDDNYKEADTTENHTMIAVVNNAAGDPKIIPGVQNLKEQFGYFAKLGSTKGMENFFKRLTTIIDKRAHSVEDLLRFLERGDLPIADDGCIIAYKILRRKNGDSTKIFVDPHTKKVTQGVGSYVCVDESLVDRNRHNECSNGLHIARRGYLGNFSGDLVTLCKIKPEDVITVPHNDANKVRVCGYHILFELPQDAFNKLKSNRPATDIPEVAKMLSMAIAGNHPAAREEVRITGQLGDGLVITSLITGKKINEAEKTDTAHVALDDETNSPIRVSPKEVAQTVATAKGTNTRRDRAQEYMKIISTGTKTEACKAAIDLLEYKKIAKVSWDSLGIDEAARQLLKSVVTPKPEVVETKPPIRVEPEKMTPSGSVRYNIIQGYLDKMNDETSAPDNRAQAATDLLAFRKKAKVGWPKLGHPKLTDDDLRSMIARMAIAKAAAPAYVKPDHLVSVGTGTNAEIARKLFVEGNYEKLYAFKRDKKKNWANLGFNHREIDTIVLHDPRK